jgi:hypothetical protein
LIYHRFPKDRLRDLRERCAELASEFEFDVYFINHLMPLSFFQPKMLCNALSEAGLIFKYANSSAIKCLFADCKDLAAGLCYSPSSQPEATPATYGCWFPQVNSQAELDANFTVISTSAGVVGYYFFKANETGVYVLTTATTLASAFEDGTPVPVQEQDDKTINLGNIGAAILQLDDDGPVILIGILDIGVPDRR